MNLHTVHSPEAVMENFCSLCVVTILIQIKIRYTHGSDCITAATLCLLFESSEGTSLAVLAHLPNLHSLDQEFTNADEAAVFVGLYIL